MGAAGVGSTYTSELRLWIRDVGFPVVVALILLLRFDTQLTRLVETAVAQTVELQRIELLLRARVPDVSVVGAWRDSRGVFVRDAVGVVGLGAELGERGPRAGVRVTAGK